MRRLRWRAASIRLLAALALCQPAWAEPSPFDSVSLAELPLPPVGAACASAAGAASALCLAPGVDAAELGGYLPGGKTIVLRLRLTSGDQLVLIRSDGGSFAGGSAWTCLTCGLSPGEAAVPGARFDGPQPFGDGRRIFAGQTVYDCTPFPLADERCNARTLRAYPVRPAWDEQPGLRLHGIWLHPDGRHVGFGASDAAGAALPFVWTAALRNEGARYVLADPQLLFRDAADARLVRPGRAPHSLVIDRTAIEIEELRGFSADGREIYYRGMPWEAFGANLFAVDVGTGAVRPLTREPGMTGPVAASPDGRLLALGDARGNGRRRFAGGLGGLPPLADLAAGVAVHALDRTDNASADLAVFGSAGEVGGDSRRVLSASTTGWSVSGAPAWSPDGTAVTGLQVANSARSDGRRAVRLIVARLVGHPPVAPVRVEPLPDAIVWATPAAPSAYPGDRTRIAAGRHLLRGTKKGEARIVVTRSSDGRSLPGVAVSYDDYSDGPDAPVNGEESVAASPLGTVAIRANLARAGSEPARKLSGPEGYGITVNPFTGAVTTTGWLATTIGTATWHQPDVAPATGK
jgi:hypothetical protein